MPKDMTFNIIDATIDSIHNAYKSGDLTVRRLVEIYLERIAAFDRSGPQINSVISTNPLALEQADALDAKMKSSGFVGPLHGIPMIMKDQGDVKEMPTTMGSVLFKDNMPGRDSFVVGKLREAGVIFIGKSTLGELGAGDTHGSLFGSTKNVYDPLRTAGGSSGGSGAAVSANFCAVAIGQEGYASIRRPSIWNGVAGMRPSAGFVSRTGVYAGWPSIIGSLGPMARQVRDIALTLDSMVGYDPDDPITALGAGKAPKSFVEGLDPAGLKGKRIGILRESMGFRSEPDSEDFAKVTEVFDRAVEDLRKAGAEIVDPVVIPDLKALLALRARREEDDLESFSRYVEGIDAPFKSKAEAMASPLFDKVSRGARLRWMANEKQDHYTFMLAREKLMLNLHQVMAEHRLDAIVHKAVEHQPTLIAEGLNPPYYDQRGAPHINTFLIYVPSVVVPAGFTRDNLPAGITFLGRPYEDAKMLQLAYAYEQATNHRRPPDIGL